MAVARNEVREVKQSDHVEAARGTLSLILSDRGSGWKSLSKQVI